MERTLVAKWESRSGKHYVELFEDDYGFSYRAPGQGGSFGSLTRNEVMLEMEKRVFQGWFLPDAAKTPMKRVK